MKFFHVADLHLGKRYHEFSMIDDQAYILSEIVGLCKKEEPDALIIAGDVYDKTVPTIDAVELFNGFLEKVNALSVPVLMISGNHDSAERLAFGGKLFTASRVYTAPVYSGKTEPVTISDRYGEVDFWLLPFIKPATVRRFFEGEKIESYTDAVKAAIGAMEIDEGRRNVLVCHQFVTGSSPSGSEEFNVGDIGNVDAALFDKFDYVALGHIHRRQSVGSQKVCYSGAPLKYSLSETGEKSLSLVELGKDKLITSTIELKPLRQITEIKGSYEKLTSRDFYLNTTYRDDYIHVVLTDEEEVPDAFAKLRLIYRNLATIRYENTRTLNSAELGEVDTASAATPMEAFAQLYELQNNRPMDEGQSAAMGALIEKIWGEEI